jgi:flagellar basal-body rod protein FlgF/flagellar basal-body rod protein FlgG
MDSGLYAAYTGLLSRTQALDTAANNLANTATGGFRAEKDFFRGVMVDNLGGSEGDSQVGGTVNSYGVLGGSALDFSQGATTTTGNPLDLALEGDGFFAIQTQRGVRYTRDGGFTRSATGTLQTSQGEPVLDGLQQPILIPTGEVNVAANGTVSVATPAGSNIVGQIGVFSFADKRVLQADGTNRFSAPAGTVPIAGTATVRQGAIEGSNEDAVQGTMQMVLTQRQAELMQKALTVFYTEFDKTAAEELGKV